MTFNTEGIPDELKTYPNWVLWKYVERDGKSTKVPFDPKRTWKSAKSNDPATWGTWDQVTRAYSRGDFAGIGFQFSHSPFFGVDFDHKPYGEGIHPRAGELLEALGTYTEFSPSFMGQHAIGRGQLPAWATNKKQLEPDLEIEVYSEGRFFTITGEPVFDFGITDAQEGLESLLKSQGMEKATPQPRAASTGLTVAFTGNDNQLWERIFSSSNGAAVRALADGDLTQHGGDHSRADFALCSHLAFWCNGDAARMDSMFRASGLYRPKWDAKHRSDGGTYGQMTIEQVLARWDGEGYSPGRRREEQENRPAAQEMPWSDPQVLLKGRQHLASSGSHGASINSYAALWQALIHVIGQGWWTEEGNTLTLTPYGMTELYAHAGGRPMDRRQQLQFLQANGMVGKLVRQDPTNYRSAWLLTMPTSPTLLPFWSTQEGLCPLRLNQKARRHIGISKFQVPSVNNYYERESPNFGLKLGFFPFWTVFALSVLGAGTTAEIADLTGLGERQIRRHLDAVPTLVRKQGWRWISTLNPEQIGMFYLSLTAEQVDRRRRKILEDRLEFHENKFRVLSSRGLNKQAAIHFRYAEKYRKHLGVAA